MAFLFFNNQNAILKGFFVYILRVFIGFFIRLDLKVHDPVKHQTFEGITIT